MNRSLRHYMTSAIVEEVKHEIDKNEETHGPFHSLHEGLSVLREEYQELEQEIFWGYQKTGNTDGIRAEALQVAAVAMQIVMMVSPVPFDLPGANVR